MLSHLSHLHLPPLHLPRSSLLSPSDWDGRRVLDAAFSFHGESPGGRVAAAVGAQGTDAGLQETQTDPQGTGMYNVCLYIEASATLYSVSLFNLFV